MFDVACIGALNLDYVVTSRRFRRLPRNVARELETRFEHGAERRAEEAEVDTTISHLGTHYFEPRLGGSAFNVVQALAHLNPAFRLSYVGVAGDVVACDLDFLVALRGLNVDISFVSRKKGMRSGISVSYTKNGSRSLLTFPGANALMASHLKDNFYAIVRALSHARLLHVTSFLDSQTPALLLRLLVEVKDNNPNLRISLDPGHGWIADSSPEVHELMMLSNILLLNHREFGLLGGNRQGWRDAPIGHLISRGTQGQTSMLLVKKSSSITLITSHGGTLNMERYPTLPIATHMISDDTGAGDIFAAGFLAGLLSPGAIRRDAVELGLHLTQLKLRDPNIRSLSTFAEIFKKWQKTSFSPKAEEEEL